MLPRTLTNRLCLALVNFTKGFLFAGLAVLGLLPIRRGRGTVECTGFVTGYSIVAGLTYAGFYMQNLYAFLTDEHLVSFFNNVSRVTMVLQALCSVLIICFFYAIAISYRFRFASYYSRLVDKYSTYRVFYGANFSVGRLTEEDVDGEEELYGVFMRIFAKTLVVPSLVFVCCCGVSLRNIAQAQLSVWQYLGLLLMPYLVQSLTTSFLFYSGVRTAFLYKRMEQRLTTIQRELGQLSRPRVTPYERMRRCCELSDLLDDLARCYETLNDSFKDLIDLHRFQILVTFLYTMANSVHRLFVQYMVVYMSIDNTALLDPILLAMNFSNIALGIVELLFLVHVTDSCHTGSIKVGRRVQRLIYYQKMDIRLQQSVRTPGLLSELTDGFSCRSKCSPSKSCTPSYT